MRNSMKIAFTAGLFVAFTGTALAENIAVTGGKVVTVSEAGTIENGTILISDGKISAVGAGLAVPDGYRVIDAGGNWVTPGLMQAQSRIGAEEVSLESSTTEDRKSVV